MADDSIQPAGSTEASTDPLTDFQATLPGSFTGYAALQHQLNISFPAALNKTEDTLRAALRSLG